MLFINYEAFTFKCTSKFWDAFELESYLCEDLSRSIKICFYAVYRLILNQIQYGKHFFIFKVWLYSVNQNWGCIFETFQSLSYQSLPKTLWSSPQYCLYIHPIIDVFDLPFCTFFSFSNLILFMMCIAC